MHAVPMSWMPCPIAAHYPNRLSLSSDDLPDRTSVFINNLAFSDVLFIPLLVGMGVVVMSMVLVVMLTARLAVPFELTNPVLSVPTDILRQLCELKHVVLERY